MGKRDLNKGPANSYWGYQLNQFLNGYLDEIKTLDLCCFDDREADNAVRAFRAFKKRYDLPIDISKKGCVITIIHRERAGDIYYETLPDGRKVS